MQLGMKRPRHRFDHLRESRSRHNHLVTHEHIHSVLADRTKLRQVLPSGEHFIGGHLGRRRRGEEQVEGDETTDDRSETVS